MVSNFFAAPSHRQTREIDGSVRETSEVNNELFLVSRMPVLNLPRVVFEEQSGHLRVVALSSFCHVAVTFRVR